MNLRALIACLLFCLMLSAAAQETPLHVTLTSGRTFDLPVEVFGNQLYTPRSGVDNLLRAAFSDTRIRWDVATGIYRVQVGGHDFFLHRGMTRVTDRHAIIDVPLPLYEARGKLYIPLASLEVILERLDIVEHNIKALRDKAETTLPATSGDSLPDVMLDTPSDSPFLDAASIVDTLRLITADDNLDSPGMGRSLTLMATPLLQRTTVIIDPQTQPVRIVEGGDAGLARAGQASDPGPEFTWQVARRCQSLLENNPEIQVVLTRENHSELPDRLERSRRIAASDARALLCLRLDRSTFPENRGYRLYTTHEAIDPAGRLFHGHQDAPLLLPVTAQYLPYQNLSLVLARLLDQELIRGGFSPAPDKLNLAPLWMLKRAPMPALTLTIGYSSNPGEQNRLGDIQQVDAVARSLAQSLLLFDNWLKKAALEDAR